MSDLPFLSRGEESPGFLSQKLTSVSHLWCWAKIPCWNALPQNVSILTVGIHPESHWADVSSTVDFSRCPRKTFSCIFFFSHWILSVPWFLGMCTIRSAQEYLQGNPWFPGHIPNYLNSISKLNSPLSCTRNNLNAFSTSYCLLCLA